MVSASAEGKSTRTFDDIFLMLEKSQAMQETAGGKTESKKPRRSVDEIGEVVQAVEMERGRRPAESPAQPGTSAAVSMAPATAQRAVDDDAEAGIRYVVAVLENLAPKATATTPSAVMTTSGASHDDRERDISEIIRIMSNGARVPGGKEDDVVSIVEAAGQPPVIDRTHAAPLGKNSLAPAAPPHRTAPATGRRLYVFGPTRPGATLADVAEQLLPSNSVTVEQMMWALYLKNPDAFMNKNINSLKAHHVLNVPEPGEVAAISRSVAETEISRLRGQAKPKVSAAF
jgi:FimV-like protein